MHYLENCYPGSCRQLTRHCGDVHDIGAEGTVMVCPSLVLSGSAIFRRLFTTVPPW